MKKILYILLLIVMTSSVMAQVSLMSWQYTMGFPSGNLKDYIGKTSFRGATYDYTKLVNGGLGVGLEFGWYTFYEEKAYDTYTYNNWDISGRQYRYTNHIPLLATLSYYLYPDNDFTPFAGFGIGTMWSERLTSMGTWNFYKDAWPFTIRPELGVLVNKGDMGFSLSSKYLYGFKTGDLESHGFFTLNFGLVFIR